VRLGHFLLFGLIGGAAGGLIYQVGLIVVSNASWASAIFSLSYLLFTIPAGILVGLVAGLFARLTDRCGRETKSRELRSVLIGCAAFVGATIAAEVAAIPLYVGPPPSFPSILIGILAAIAFGLYAWLMAGRQK
jgi:hypothetical protein